MKTIIANTKGLTTEERIAVELLAEGNAYGEIKEVGNCVVFEVTDKMFPRLINESFRLLGRTMNVLEYNATKEEMNECFSLPIYF